MRLQHLSSFSCDLASWWANVIANVITWLEPVNISQQFRFHPSDFLQMIRKWPRSDLRPQTHTHKNDTNDTNPYMLKRVICTPPSPHTSASITCKWLSKKQQKKNLQGHIIESTWITSKLMGLTAAWCRRIVLQHTEQDKCKIDEPDDRKQWTSQRGRALKRGLGEAAEGKWKKINRRIKRLMRH